MARPKKDSDDEKREIDHRWTTERSLSWKLYPWQVIPYEKMPEYGAMKSSDQREFVLLEHRDAGKSHKVCVKVLETVKNYPGLSVNIFAGTGKQGRAIYAPKFAKISADAPKECRPKYSTADECYYVNECSISVNGGTTGTADNQRGRDFDVTNFDEPMMIPEIEYLYESVVQPRLLTGSGVCYWSSSAPKTPAHYFAKKIEHARRGGYLYTFTIRDNPKFTKDDIKRIADAMGGEDSTRFRREMMCEVITDEDAAVIPELITDKSLIPVDAGIDAHSLSDLPLYSALAYHDIGETSIIIFTVLDNYIRVLEEVSFKNVNAKTLSDFYKTSVEKKYNRRIGTILSNLDKKDALALSRVTSSPIMFTDYPKTIDRVKFARSALNDRRVVFSPGTEAVANNLSDAIYNDAKNDLFEGLFSRTEAFTVMCERFGSSNHVVHRQHRFGTGADFFI